jgi:hypothetical protein
VAKNGEIHGDGENGVDGGDVGDGSRLQTRWKLSEMEITEIIEGQSRATNH